MAEVCYLLSEYRESVKKYKYVEYEQIYKKRSNINPQEPEEGEEKPVDLFAKWEKEQLQHENLEVLNLRKEAQEYLSLGHELMKARNELAENYHVIIQTNLTDPSKIPNEFLHEIFENQAIQSSVFLESVNETMEPDLWSTLKKAVKSKVDSGEIISVLKSLIDEVRYFTFRRERSSKGISLIHRYLRLNLASYVQK